MSFVLILQLSSPSGRSPPSVMVISALSPESNLKLSAKRVLMVFRSDIKLSARRDSFYHVTWG